LLNEKENALAALRRYSGKGANKNDRDMTKFNELTECADTLLSEGCGNIYSDSRERLFAEIKEDELEEQERSHDHKEAVLWEYKLKDGTTFGPYTSQDMASWSQQGYFSADSGALVRRVKKTVESLFAEDGEEDENDAEFVPSNTVDFTAYL